MKRIISFIIMAIFMLSFAPSSKAEVIGSTLFEDNFESGISKWTPQDSTKCSIVNDGTDNAYQLTSASGTSVLSYAGDTNWTNYRITAKINPKSLGTNFAGGLIFRYTNASNYIMVRFAGDSSTTKGFELYKWEAGTSKLILTKVLNNFTTNTWFDIVIDVVDNFATVKINNSTIFNYVDIGTVNSKGAVGARVYSGTTLVDDLKVESLVENPADTAIYTVETADVYSESGSAWEDSAMSNYQAGIKTRVSKVAGNTAVWSAYSPNLAINMEANYKVFAWIPLNNTNSSVVTYSVNTLNGTWYKDVNQTLNGGSWALIATVKATGDTAISTALIVKDGMSGYATAIKVQKTTALADTTGAVGGGTDTTTVSIKLNQTGFDIDSSKRATITNVPDGTDFYIKKVGTNETAFSGKVNKSVADFTTLNPNTKTEYYLECGSVKSYEFTIAKNWFQRISVPYAIEFMDRARNDAWLPGLTSIAWRDSHQFSYELPSLVLQYMSNPSLYENLPRGIYKLNETQFSNLRVQNEPDIIWLMKYGMEWYYKNNVVDGMNLHPLVKEQCAYFLYIYPYIKEYVSEADYLRFRDMTIHIWGDSSTTNMLQYYQVTGEKSNLFEVQNVVGSIKGSFPPGHSIVPNLMMYEVVKRDGLGGEQKYFDAAYNNCDYILKTWDITDVKYSKGQRMSEHFLMENLAYFQEMYPDKSPSNLKSEINRWADKMIARSDNQWDMRMATSVKAGDSADYWTGGGWAYGTGVATSIMNEPGNEIGMQSISYAASRVLDDAQKIKRLKEIGDASRDNMFGRNPYGRTFFYSDDGITKIEGADLGWFSKHGATGNGKLGEVPGRIDSSPKEVAYPFAPSADPGYVEGWVAFNTNWNSALAYTAADDLQISVDKDKCNNGETINIRLKAPINIDYTKRETAVVYVTNKTTGTVEKINLTEEDEDNFYFSGTYTVPNTTCQIEISYGVGLFKVAQNISVVGQNYKPITSISLDKSTLSMTVNDVVNLSVSQILPIDATYKTVVWSSSNPNIATVDSNGVATAKAAGTATITVNGSAETDVKAMCVATVSAAPEPNATIVNLDFNSTASTNMWGFTKSGTDFDVVQTTDPSDINNKVIQLKGGNTYETPGISTFNIPTTNVMNEFKVIFDIFAPLTTSGDTFIRFTDNTNKDIFSLYSRESGDGTNIKGKTMRYGLNTVLGPNSLATNTVGSAKLLSTPETGNVGTNGTWYRVVSDMNFKTKKQNLTIYNRETGAKVIELAGQDIENATGLNKLLVGYGYDSSTYPGVYLDNFMVITGNENMDVMVNSFTIINGVISINLFNSSFDNITNSSLLIACYDENGRLCYVKINNLSLNSLTNLNLTYNIEEQLNKIKLVKLYILKNFETMIPLSLSKSTYLVLQ